MSDTFELHARGSANGRPKAGRRMTRAGSNGTRSLKDVKAAADAKSAVIIDANSPDSYKAGHVPGADLRLPWV